MAIPLTNASLQDALNDLGAVSDKQLTNPHLMRRSYNRGPAPLSPFHFRDVMGSVACIQPLSGSNKRENLLSSYTRNYNGMGISTIYENVIDAENGGSHRTQFSNKANVGDCGISGEHNGYLPASGTVRFTYQISSKSSQSAQHVACIGYKTNWGEGAAKFYVDIAVGSLGVGTHTRDFTIDPEYRYLCCFCYNLLLLSSQVLTASGTYNYARAYLI